ncbi:LacI family DNA-binding transcriptional regulator [Tateyamaria sp.]|uniref:LacI family DNA-binding transcriptional regulator n=1 Tax=Tateyamaria sp. TaxID=1929288 RepID=UPI00329B080F
MPDKPVNLKSLAAHLGLTVGTVSRAMNDYADISVATRQRVQKAAAELGYRPNQNARRLSLGQPETVCYLMPRQTGVTIQPFVAQLLQGLGEALGRRNWDLLVHHAESSQDDLERIDRLVRTGRVGGIVISRPLKNDPRVQLLKDLGCPFVVHGRTAEFADYAWYDVDGEDALVTAVNHLADLGHRRIAYVGAPLQHQFAQERLNGYNRAVLHNGLTPDPQLIQIANFSDDGGEMAASILLDLPEPPTGIVCVSDTVAFGVLAGIRARGMQPGQDVSVIGYDGLHFGIHANPPLTTMAQPQAHAGRRLGDMLLAIVDGGDPKAHQELQRAHLVRRKTDGPPLQGAVQDNVSEREDIQ